MASPAEAQGESQQAPVAQLQGEPCPPERVLWAVPRARRGVSWWPHPPLPSGGRETFTPAGKVEPLRGMRSNKTHVLFVGGPLHRRRLPRYFKMGERGSVQLVPNLQGQPFTVAPYRGCYLYDTEADRYEWKG